VGVGLGSGAGVGVGFGVGAGVGVGFGSGVGVGVGFGSGVGVGVGFGSGVGVGVGFGVGVDGDGGAGPGRFSGGGPARIVRVAVREIPPCFAVMVTVVSTATDDVSMVKDAVGFRASTITAAGTSATPLLLVSNTTFAADSVAAVNVTTPVGCPCCRIVEGEMLNDCSVAVTVPDDDGGVDGKGGGVVAGVGAAITADGPTVEDPSSCVDELPLLTSSHAVNDSTKMYPMTHPVVFITGLPFLRVVNSR